MPNLIALLMIRPAGVAEGLLNRLRPRKYVLVVPDWDDGPYGKLSEGFFWDAHKRWLLHQRLTRFWAAWYYGLGSLAVVLAAFAGFGGLSALLGVKQAAFITIGSSIAMILVIFLRCDDKRQENRELAQAWDGLRDEIAALYMMRPTSNKSRGRGGATGQPRDADEWRTVIQELSERITKLRTGEALPERPLLWPHRDSAV
jgi:hypothetical protein